MESKGDTERLIRQLGGIGRISRRLTDMGHAITPQGVSRWRRRGAISQEFHLPMIILCQEDGLDWQGHDDLRRNFGLAMRVVKNARRAAQDTAA